MTNNQTLASASGRWTLIATILASSMAFIDGSALNVALPVIQEALDATGADLLWIINAYLLMLASFILIGGSLGDHYGRKRIFRIGIIIFSAASLVCGLAPTTGILIIARAIQGIGGALMVPGSLAIISATFAPQERGKAIGIWSSASTITNVGGPILGGFLASAGLWRFVFFINLPLAILSLYALSFAPETKDETAPRQLDFAGAVAIVLSLAGLTYGLVTLGDLGIEAGIQDPLVLLGLLVGVLSLIAFVFIEARSDHPMVNLEVFRSRTFSGANVMTGFLYGALSGALIFLPINLIGVQGYEASSAGFTMLPVGILLTLLSPWAGGLLDRYGPRPPLIVGPLIVGLGFFLISLVGITNGPTDYFTSFFPGILGIGLGMGITVAPLTGTVMGAVDSSHSGIASGINNAVTRSAQVLVTALVGAIVLVIFAATLKTELLPLNLAEEARQQIEASAGNLINTVIPDTLDELNQEAVTSAVKISFVQTFQTIVRICAVLCLLSATMAAIIIEPTIKSKKRVEAVEMD